MLTITARLTKNKAVFIHANILLKVRSLTQCLNFISKWKKAINHKKKKKAINVL